MTRSPRLYQAYIDRVMISGIPDPQARRVTITLYLDPAAVQRSLGRPHLASADALLLDLEGQVCWREEGAYTPGGGSRLWAAAEPLPSGD